MTPDDRANAALPIAAELACAIDAHDAEAVAAALTPLSRDDLYALAVVLAAHVDVNGPLVPTFGSKRTCQTAARHAAVLYDVEVDDVFSTARHREVSMARIVAMTVARRAGHSTTEIGRHFGRDHSTVMHASRRGESDPRLRVAVEQVARHMGITREEDAA